MKDYEGQKVSHEQGGSLCFTETIKFRISPPLPHKRSLLKQKNSSVWVLENRFSKPFAPLCRKCLWAPGSIAKKESGLQTGKWSGSRLQTIKFRGSDPGLQAPPPSPPPPPHPGLWWLCFWALYFYNVSPPFSVPFF